MRRGSDMSSKQKAAILMISLGPEVASNVYRHLREDEIEQLTLEIASIRKVESAERTPILAELPQNIRADVAKRIAMMEATSPEVINPANASGRRKAIS